MNGNYYVKNSNFKFSIKAAKESVSNINPNIWQLYIMYEKHWQFHCNV